MIQNRLSKYPVQILKYKTKTKILKKTWANPEDVPKTHLFKTSRFQKKKCCVHICGMALHLLVCITFLNSDLWFTGLIIKAICFLKDSQNFSKYPVIFSKCSIKTNKSQNSGLFSKCSKKNIKYYQNILG
jgi:mRNA-degrading endonuclease HigB of HigAB toxin-antitoxin module